jgi:hypothetical protein
VNTVKPLIKFRVGNIDVFIGLLPRKIKPSTHRFGVAGCDITHFCANLGIITLDVWQGKAPGRPQ